MTDMQSRDDRIRMMITDDLDIVLAWRNHDDIRRFMYTTHKITMPEHQRWFELAARSPHKHLLIFEANKSPMGFIQLDQLRGGPVAEWGFYAAPDAPKGIGKRLGKTALRYAFETLGLHKICGQALSYNESSIRFHDALGFQKEGLLKEQHFDGQNYHDVICFGLLISEWQSNFNKSENYV